MPRLEGPHQHLKIWNVSVALFEELVISNKENGESDTTRQVNGLCDRQMSCSLNCMIVVLTESA